MIQQESSHARAAVDDAMRILLAQGMGGTGGSDALRQLQTATEALGRIQTALGRFEIGPPYDLRRS
jgi:hypothetical protein